MTGSIKLIIELKNMMERDIISLENKLMLPSKTHFTAVSQTDQLASTHPIK